jgi:hypothetical protein
LPGLPELIFEESIDVLLWNRKEINVFEIWGLCCVNCEGLSCVDEEKRLHRARILRAFMVLLAVRRLFVTTKL